MTAKKTAAPPARKFVNKDKACSTKGCDKPAYCKGMCKACHGRAYRATPENRAKANAASKASRARRLAAEAEKKGAAK